MPINYTKLPVQVGAFLQNLRKTEARLDHTYLASASTHDRRLLSQANGLEQTDTEEARAYGRQLGQMDGDLAPTLRGMWVRQRSEIEHLEDFFGIIAADIPVADADRGFGAILYEYDDVDGAISILKRRGILGELYSDMLANTQRVTPNVITFGSFTAENGNLGELEVTSMSGISHAIDGTLVFVCVDESVDAPKLTVQNELDLPLPDGLTVIAADNQLQCEKSFEDGPTALTTTLTRAKLTDPDVAGEPAAPMFSAITISTPKSADMEGGVLQVRVSRQAAAPIWLVEFFADSERTVKVGRFTTDTTAGTAAIDVTLRAGTRVVATFSRVNANTALPAYPNTDDDITFNIRTPRLGDTWRRTIASDEAGNFSTKIARAWRVSLPTASGTLWSDAAAASVSMS